MRRPEDATLAGMVTIFRRRVAVVAFARTAPVIVAAAGVRLNAMLARTSQAAFAFRTQPISGHRTRPPASAVPSGSWTTGRPCSCVTLPRSQQSCPTATGSSSKQTAPWSIHSEPRPEINLGLTANAGLSPGREPFRES